MALKSFLGLLLATFGLGIIFFFSPDLNRWFKTPNTGDQVSRLLESLMSAPQVFITDSVQEIKTRKCQYFTCFDVYRCGGPKLLVHIPQAIQIMIGKIEPKEVSPLTKEFVDMLEAIVQSGFYTENPSEACLFVPAFNLLNEADLDPVVTSQALSILPEWNYGTNNLLFSMITGHSDSLRIEHGSSLVAAAGLSTFSYRSRFDVALPYYSVLQEQLVKKYKNKSYLLVITQGGDLHDKFEANLHQWKSKNDVVVYFNYANDEAIKQDQYNQLVETNDILAKGRFCLVGKEKYGRLTTSILMAAMHAGCIPVIVIDHLVLPFSEVLDWKRFSIRFYEHDANKIYNHLKNIPENKYHEMRAQVKYVYDKYFKDLATITQTTLQIINDRVFPQQAKTYFDWNVQYDTRSPLIMKSSPPDGFTAVVLTFDR